MTVCWPPSLAVTPPSWWQIEQYGVTVAMLNGHVTENRLADIAGKTRNVPDNCELLTVARRMGISMG